MKHDFKRLRDKMERLGIVALVFSFIVVFQTTSDAGPFGRLGRRKEIPYGEPTFPAEASFDCCGEDPRASFRPFGGFGISADHSSVRTPLIGEGYWVGEKVPLFNGVDLTGWTNFQGGAPTDGWVVQDGAIYKKEGATGDLFTEKEYDHFILEFEFKIEPKTNSGVKYKTWNRESGGMGCEYQVFDQEGGDAGPLHETASLYDVYEPAGGGEILKLGEFNQGKIVVMGNYIEHWLNGVRTVSTVIDSADWRARVAKSKFAENPEFGHIGRSRLFLQDHGTPVWFKNFTITELTPVCEIGIAGIGQAY